MNAPVPFEYAVVRVVPRVERGEFVNAGVVVYCHAADFLDAAAEVDAARVHALDPEADVSEIVAAVDAFVAMASATPGEDRLATASLGERFRWLTAPRSTVVQAGPAHAGLTADPAAELDRLMDRLVR